MKKETKIRTFETDLSVRQLRNKLNGKSNIFINIVLYLFAGCYAAMSVFVMFYSAVLGVIMLLCLAALAWCVQYLLYADILKNNYVKLGENQITIKSTAGADRVFGSRKTIPYADFKKYYVGDCHASFIPKARNRRLLSDEQCNEIFGEYINLIGDGINVLAVVPYAKEREELLREKCNCEKITENEYKAWACECRSGTPQEREIADKYNGYIN